MNLDEKIDIINKIGYLLIKNGAEIYRVEDSIRYMCKSYQFQNVNIFILPSYYDVTFTYEEKIYRFSNSSKNNGLDFSMIYFLNKLVRDICDHNLEKKEIFRQLRKLEKYSMYEYIKLIGFIFNAGACTVFYGGHIYDVIVSSINGILIYCFFDYAEKNSINELIVTIISSMMITLTAIFFVGMGISDNIAYIIKGSIMLLVPGIAITTSLRDIADKNYYCGLSRMCEAFLIASCIAIGVGTVLKFTGRFY